MPAGSSSAVPPVPEQALPPQEALLLARRLLAEGRAFAAHEVFEAVWKGAPSAERDLWQGLAQVCVGLTHLQRGNPVGAARLLRRGAGRLSAYAGGRRAGMPPAAYDPAALVGRVLDLAARVEAGEQVGAELAL